MVIGGVTAAGLPLAAFVADSVPVIIGSDDPAILGFTWQREYDQGQTVVGPTSTCTDTATVLAAGQAQL